MFELLSSVQSKVNNFLESSLFNLVVAKMSHLLGKFLGILNVSISNPILKLIYVLLINIVGIVIIKYLLKLFKSFVNKVLGKESETRTPSVSYKKNSSSTRLTSSSHSSSSSCSASNTSKYCSTCQTEKSSCSCASSSKRSSSSSSCYNGSSSSSSSSSSCYNCSSSSSSSCQSCVSSSSSSSSSSCYVPSSSSSSSCSSYEKIKKYAPYSKKCVRC
jgi:hypothetical protein